MADKGGKLMIETEFMQFELNLQNNYKDLAEQYYRKTRDMLDSFLEQGEITERYYNKMQKKLKKYDDLYQSEDVEE